MASELLLQNINNYGDYSQLVLNGRIDINVASSISKDNLDTHFNWILNILRDGIEDDSVHSMMINVIFADNIDIELSIFDYVFNLIFWKLPLSVGEILTSEFLFFEEAITKDAIKNYIDTRFLDHNRTKYPNMVLNNCIDDCLDMFKYIDEFSLYALNTINNEDSIDLMNESPVFWEALHADLSGVPIEDVKKVGMDYTNNAIREIIASQKHCLCDSFLAGEGISAKQFKEFLINIGSKPDGNGGIYPAIINNSFSNGGINDVASFTIESAVGQQALILNKQFVGSSGHFARLLGLNNMNTIIHPDPNYVCNTKHFEKILIKDAYVLKLFKNRYFRFTPNGVDKKLSSNPVRDNYDMIGKELYFRSPMTCASSSRGEGVCYKCYGDLAYTNYDINLGKLAAELISSRLTQMLLSAKHILESLVQTLEWSPGFNDIFDVNYNLIKIKEEFNCKKHKLIIPIDAIQHESEDDDFDYNEYISSFDIQKPNGSVISIYTSNLDNIYITCELAELIRRKKDIDGMYIFEMSELLDIDLFLVKLTNNELSRTLEGLRKLLNTNAAVQNVTKDQILQNMIDTLIAGGLNIDSVHAEILLSNQIRDAEDQLKRVSWEYANAKYKLITLNTALIDNPSVTVSLEYQKLAKALYYPLTYKKTDPSPVDLLFMIKPQQFMRPELVNGEPVIEPEVNEDEIISPIKYV